MANSVQHCSERIRFFQAEFDANQRRVNDALKELKWWQEELMVAQREEADRTRHEKAA